VKTYPQAWATEKCAAQKGFQNRFIPAKTSEALTLLNDSLVSLINAFDFKTAKGVIDGVVGMQNMNMWNSTTMNSWYRPKFDDQYITLVFQKPVIQKLPRLVQLFREAPCNFSLISGNKVS
jgi:hypothetical protein